ncbi:MAG: hypothetical protein ACREBC_28835, partial [Pyrinomonadaceae bacterium]
MAITKDVGRQETITAMVDINFGDVSPSASDQDAVQVPANAIVVAGDVTVITAFNSATSDVLSVGDSVTFNRYLNGGNIAALA